MKLVLSSSYLEQELSVIFGKIPPCFLPFENKRLYEHQLKYFSEHDKDIVVITLPKDFHVEEADARRLKNFDCVIHRACNSSSIGEVIYEVLEKFKPLEIEILFGDTLINNKKLLNTNLISVSKKYSAYDWHCATEELIWCGHFNFTLAQELKEILEKTNLNVFDAVESYQGNNKVSYEEVHKEDWLDFGHIKTFLNSKRYADTSRVFNKTDVKADIFEKKSRNFEKLSAEYEWFCSIEGDLIMHLPRIIGIDMAQSSYKLEYVNSLTISELIVFSNIDRFAILKIFENISSILMLMREEPNNKNSNDLLSFLNFKFNDRSAEIKNISSKFFDPSGYITLNDKQYPNLFDIHDHCTKNLSKKSIIAKVHGDFCASNLLYSPWNERVYMIDPRGISKQSDWQNIDDQRYDVAKLAHSIIGNYDKIIAGNYHISGNKKDGYSFEIFDDTEDEWHSFFWELCSSIGISCSDVSRIMVTLFITMVPLHHDNEDRQLAFLLNACLLFGGINDYNTNGRS